MNSTDIVLPETGQVIEMNQEGLYLAEQIPTGAVLVDGLGIGDVGNVVLRDRKHLSQDGLIIVVMAINRDDQRLVSGPDIISRGFISTSARMRILLRTRAMLSGRFCRSRRWRARTGRRSRTASRMNCTASSSRKSSATR